VHTRSTAGQATIEYVAAIALITAIFLVAGPAVGAPAIGKQVVHGIRLGICLVADDVCSSSQAKAEGLAPCPLKADTKGVEVSASVLFYEVGGKSAVTVTSQSDGSVTIVRTRGASGGLTRGVGFDLHAGPLSFDIGVNGVISSRLQASQGWTFPDQASAARFLAHGWHAPPTWVAGDKTLLEGNASLGLQAGLKGFSDRYALAGVASSAGALMGARVARDGLVTAYIRVDWTPLDLGFSLRPSTGTGDHARTIELTFDHGTPREIAFRSAEPEASGNRLVDTVERLDLRDGANRAAAGPLFDAYQPLQRLMDALRALHARIPEHGTIERTVSDYDDDSSGISGAVGVGSKLGAGYKKLKIHKQLISATARTQGSRDRDRFDCTGDQP
jgi:hypothetical protein